MTAHTIFLCREEEMVRMPKWPSAFLAYNLRRAINLLGAGALVAHFNARNRKNRELKGPLLFAFSNDFVLKMHNKKGLKTVVFRQIVVEHTRISNPWPLQCECSALPTVLMPQIFPMNFVHIYH